MKLYALILSVVFGAIILTSCGGSKNSDNPFIGKWEITEAEGTMAEMNKGTVYEFIDDSNVEFSLGGIKTKATYKKSGDTLSYSFGTINMSAIVKIEGNKMNFESLTSDQKFVLTKK